MWFAEAEGDIGEINADGTISESGVVAGGIGGVTTGPDGATWFTYWSSTAPHGNIGRLAADGTVTTYPMPPDPETDVIEPGVLVSAADGYMYAQLQGGESYAARISTDGAVTYLKLPSYAWDIVRGPDGAAWFTGVSPGTTLNGAPTRYFGVVGRLGPSGVTKQFTYVGENLLVPASSTGLPDQMAVGADARLWFTVSDTTKPAAYVGAVTTSGQFSFYQVSDSHDFENEIASGPDGNVWVLIEPSFILELDSNGTVVARLDSPISGGGGMATGPDDRVWLGDFRWLYAISPGGGRTTVYPPAPSVTLCEPWQAKTAPGRSLSVYGRALDRVTSVTVGDMPADFHVVSPAQVNLTIPATAPFGETSVVASDGFTSGALPGGADIEGPPTIISLTPACGTPGGGDKIYVQGTELESATSVTVGGKPATIYYDRFTNPTETDMVIVTPQHAVPNTVDVRVTTVGGTSAIVPADKFTYSPACT